VTRYRTLLFDLDHTLFDFDTSEQHAFAAALGVVGIDEDASHLPTYQRLNTALWAAAERGEIRSSEIRNLRFTQLAHELGIDADEATVTAMADAFVHGLGAHGDLYPGVADLLDSLAGDVSMAIVSNGLGEVVHARVERLGMAEWFDVVIVSSEVGVSKPHAGIFDAAFAALGVFNAVSPALGSHKRATTVMIGDSLTSDVAGGAAYGLDTVWYNRRGIDACPHEPITHEIRDLSDLTRIL
jgi:2-haloacid dehalogenase